MGLTRGGGGLYFWERTPGEYEAHGYKLCRGMKENSESALSTSKEAISNATRNLNISNYENHKPHMMQPYEAIAVLYGE